MNALEEYCRLNNISTANDSIDSSGPMSSNLGLSKLNNIRTLVIKQSFQPIEFFTGFQQENSYSVFGIDENGF